MKSKMRMNAYSPKQKMSNLSINNDIIGLRACANGLDHGKTNKDIFIYTTVK